MVKRTHLRSVATFLLILSVSVPVWANGPGRGGEPGPGGGARGAAAIGLLGQLIFPCPADCQSTANTCLSTADSDAISCIESACTTEITTAQTACGASRTSQDCRTAVAALHDCAASCLDMRTTAVTDCRDAASTCRSACTSGQ